MTVALSRSWTREQFFAWAEGQNARYEFDGTQPIAMTGGTLTHNAIQVNLIKTLRNALRGSPCRPLGPDAGVATIGAAVRYPDALITCSAFLGATHIVPEPVIVFEIVSPSSAGTDRIVKVREYQAVASIRRYVILESATIGLLDLSRTTDNDSWTAAALTEDDILDLNEVGATISVAALYDDVQITTPA